MYTSRWLWTAVVLLVFALSLTTLGAAQGDPALSLRITEIMASNGKTLEDAFGRSPDWIEMYNPTEEAISLAGVCLSDKKNQPERYAFPQDAVIQPGEYIVVFASGAKKDIADEYHTSFKLSADGEAVYLSKEGILIDGVVFGPQAKDISYALGEDGRFALTATPTPYAPNLSTPVTEQRKEGD